MLNAEQFPYLSSDSKLGEAGFRPYMPITLTNQQSAIATSALLDTGATLRLTGNLAQYEARVVVVQAEIAQFEPSQLVFAWTKAERIPLNFGTSQFLYGI